MYDCYLYLLNYSLYVVILFVLISPGLWACDPSFAVHSNMGISCCLDLCPLILCVSQGCTYTWSSKIKPTHGFSVSQVQPSPPQSCIQSVTFLGMFGLYSLTSHSIPYSVPLVCFSLEASRISHHHQTSIAPASPLLQQARSQCCTSLFCIECNCFTVPVAPVLPSYLFCVSRIPWSLLLLFFKLLYCNVWSSNLREAGFPLFMTLQLS